MTEEAVNKLLASFRSEHEKLVKDLNPDQTPTTHGPTQGDQSESAWFGFLKRYLPDRYKIASGFVIDHKGNVSEQIDIIIFDRHFTPTLFSKDGGEKAKYIPAEAVYMVFEVKQNFTPKHIRDATQKLASVIRLERTSLSMIASGKTVSAREFFEICGGLLALRGWSKGFKNKIREHATSLHCGCCLENGAFYNFNGMDFFEQNDLVLMHFTTKLLSHLNSLGSAPAIDWGKYVEMIEGQSDLAVKNFD